MGIDGLIQDLKHGIGMVRVNAAAELGKLKDKKSEQSLIDALGDENLAVRNNAAFALGELGSRTALPRLIFLLHDPEERVRKSVVKALGMIGDRGAETSLIQVLANDGSRIVRKSAIRSLGQIGGPKTVSAVEPFLSDPDPTLSDMAKKAVEMITKR
jgi:HEAT repeat protein